MDERILLVPTCHFPLTNVVSRPRIVTSSSGWTEESESCIYFRAQNRQYSLRILKMRIFWQFFPCSMDECVRIVLDECKCVWMISTVFIRVLHLLEYVKSVITPLGKVCGCYLVRFSCSPTSTNDILHNKTHVALASLRWNTCKNRNEKWTSLDLVMIIINACLLDTQVLPIVFIIKCRVVINILRHSPISFTQVSLWCLCFNPYLTTYQSNWGVRLRRRAT